MTIADVMISLLDQVNATFIENEVDLPERQLLDMGGQGETVHDCAQVTVSFEQMYNGLPGTPDQLPTRCYSPRTATFIVEVVRCTPVVGTGGRGQSPVPPTADEITIASIAQARDAYVLMDAGLTFAESLDYAGGLADISMSPESGGFQAVVLTLVVGLP